MRHIEKREKKQHQNTTEKGRKHDSHLPRVKGTKNFKDCSHQTLEFLATSKSDLHETKMSWGIFVRRLGYRNLFIYVCVYVQNCASTSHL